MIKEKTVFIIDDKPDSLGLLVDSLKNVGFETIVIRDSQIAFTQIYNSLPDIILLDIFMPKVSGLELCQHLKKIHKTKEIPIIFMTSLDEPGYKQKWMQLGAVDCIQKPIQIEIAMNKIQTYYSLQIIETKLIDMSQRLQEEIIERYKMKQKMLEENSRILSIRYQEILDAVPDIILEIDINKVITWTNLAGYRFYGEGVIGKRVLDYFISVEDTYDLIKPLFEGGENVIYVESWQRRRDGKPRLLAWWYRVIRDKEGHVTGAISTGRDITERKKAEEILKKTDLRLKNELILARETQFSLLPPSKPNFEDIMMVCHTSPAFEVGGDFYSYRCLEPRENDSFKKRYIVAIGDVSGKGVSAALLMSTCLIQFDSYLSHFSSPRNLLLQLDKTIMPYTKPRNYNCALCCVQIDIMENDTILLKVANAGCMPPYIKRKNGTIEWNLIGGFALGQGLGLKHGYKELELQLQKGDMLILCSDGLVEAINPKNEILGFENTFTMIEIGPNTHPQAMLDYLLNEVYDFTQNAELQDDLTIVVMQM
ncbi:MAG: SpoIIE family protein phosphatase [Leptospiraceae bacterium]|nr:SpoIIE family protein phosphatase [Leptospiraceae bacterium]MCP5495948.1 SpoIIE family protein phosphatase [Leptospiraceae bacterium]